MLIPRTMIWMHTHNHPQWQATSEYRRLEGVSTTDRIILYTSTHRLLASSEAALLDQARSVSPRFLQSPESVDLPIAWNTRHQHCLESWRGQENKRNVSFDSASHIPPNHPFSQPRLVRLRSQPILGKRRWCRAMEGEHHPRGESEAIR